MSLDPHMHKGQLPPRSLKKAKKMSFGRVFLIISIVLLIGEGAVIWWMWQDHERAYSTQSTDMTQSTKETANGENSADAGKAAGADKTAAGTENKQVSEDAQAGEAKGEAVTGTEQTGESGEGESKVTTHRVLPGETLYSVTMKYFGSKEYMDEVAEYNGIGTNSEIRAGTVLKIPDIEP